MSSNKRTNPTSDTNLIKNITVEEEKKNVYGIQNSHDTGRPTSPLYLWRTRHRKNMRSRYESFCCQQKSDAL